MAANYPAFNYANTYGVEISGEASGWYLPAWLEAEALLNARDTVNNAIGKIGSPAVGVSGGPYWSATLWNSTSAYYNNQAVIVPYSSGYKYDEYNVRAIRQF